MGVSENYQWLYNVKTDSWDKVISINSVSYEAWQWNRKTHDWDIKVVFDTNGAYLYYYGDVLDGPDTNGDGSVPGQIWVWNNNAWCKLTPENFTFDENTYIITHGLNNTLFIEEWMCGIAKGLKNREHEAQVLAVDWGDIADRSNIGIGDITASGIVDSSFRTYRLLEQIAQYTDKDLGAFTSSKLNLIGHSYGAHYSAYLASYLGNKPASLVGLDSAEEGFQSHEIILGPDSAREVYFYKSSAGLGGGDTGNKALGKFNFYTIEHRGDLDLYAWFDAWSDDHGYAHQFYIRTLNSSSAGIAGYNIQNTRYFEDLSRLCISTATCADPYVGIVGSSLKIECLTRGYYNENPEFKLKESSWSVSDYWSSIQELQTTTSGFVREVKSISDNVEAVSYLVDYVLIDDTIQLGNSGTLNVGEQSNITFSVYNYADNHSFTTKVLREAQENQSSSVQVWLSTTPYLNSNSIMIGEHGISVLPDSTSPISAQIGLSKEQLNKLLASDSIAKDSYFNHGNVTLYAHVVVGVKKSDGTGVATDYIAGELDTSDNISEAIPVNIANDGIQTVFVIDDTGSMGEEIAAVKSAILNYISDLMGSGSKEGPMMQLITFKDNVDVGLKTNDLQKMYDAVSSIRATDGGDEPEYSNHALCRAINMAANGATILFATDAPSHSGANISAAKAKAKEKGIKVYSVISGSMVSTSVGVPEAMGATVSPVTMSLRSMGATGADVVTAESADCDDEYTSATVLQPGDTATGTVHYGEDRYDWYSITLEKYYTYTINLQSDSRSSFLNIYASDGETEVALLENGEGMSFCPDEKTKYYLRVRAHEFKDTSYTLAVQQTAAPSTIGRDLESFAILSQETGGAYMSITSVNSGNKTAYSSAVYNFLSAQTKPVVLTCGPNALYRGTTATLTVTGSGTNWRAGQTAVSFSSEDIKVTNVEVVSATSLQVTVQVESDCTLDSYDITVQSGTETAEGRDVVTVASQPSSKKIVSVSSTAFECGKEFVATVHGYNTSWSQESTQLSLGPGVSITGYEVVSATEIRVAGTVDEDAALGYRTVQVKTSGSTLSLSHALFVTSATPESPVITSVSPNTVTVGKASEVIITGKNLDFTTSSISVDMGYGVEVQEITKVDATTLKVKVFATLESAEGFRDVLVSVDGQPVTAINGLDVLPDTVAPEVTLETPVVEKVSNGRIKVTLSWSSTEESTYVVNIDGTEHNVEGNSYSLELADGSHTYSVQASDYSGNKGTATGNFAMDATAPNPVELLHATTTKDGVAVSWQAEADAVAYMLQYAMNPDFSDAKEIAVLTGTTCLIEDVAKDGVLYVRISAADEVGNVSEWSQVTQANLDIVPPAVVSSVMGVTGENGVTVTWQTVEDAVSYTLQYAMKSDFSDAMEVSGVAAGSYLIENVDEEGLLYVRVSASDAAGNESAWSTVAQTNLDIVAPDVVQGVQAITGDKLVAVSWMAVVDAASYSIQYATKADFSDAKTISGITATSYALQPVPEMGTLYVRVAATDAAGNTSAWSSVAESALDITGPGKVDGLTVKAHGISADLSWNAASDVSGISGYFVEYADNSDFVGAQSMKIDALSATFYTLEAQTQYYWRVAAVDGVGNVGDWTVGSSFRTTEAPLEDNTPADATNIDMSSPADGSSKNMKPIEGWVGFDDPADYYCFTAKGEGAYAISLDAAVLGTQVYLSVGTLDDKGNFAAEKKLLVAPGSAAAALGDIALESGEKCYIRVESYDKGLGRYNGEYSLSVDAEVADSAWVTDNNSPDKATMLKPGGAADAALSGWVGMGDAVDYYCFELAKPAELTLGLGELETAVKVKLLREERDGGVSQVMSRSVKASRGLDHTLSLTSGTYFVEVASYDNGAGRYNTSYALELEKEEENGETRRFTIANA